MTIHLHLRDLPETVTFTKSVAIDTETMGLRPHRDRLCLVQLCAGDGICHLVQIDVHHKPTRLIALLADPAVQKIFHFARFDVAVLAHQLGVVTRNIYCTKIASKLTRTYSDRHGLKELCKELIGVEISKQEQSSNWGNAELTVNQLKYAASDVLYLHHLKEKLDLLLAREKRTSLAQSCFDFIPSRAMLDLMAGEEYDIFHH